MAVSMPNRVRAPLRASALGAAGVFTVATWVACLWTSTHVHPDPRLHPLLLFGHLASLVVGFGAVLALDWWGLLWVLRRRSLTDVLLVSSGLHLPIWLGLAGLSLTGALLEPDLDSPTTRVKLGLVLMVALNGLYAHALQRRLSVVAWTSPQAVPVRLVVRGACAALVSQCGWWGATVIGFLNTTR